MTLLVLIALLALAFLAATVKAGDWTPTRSELNTRRHVVMDKREHRCLHTWRLSRLASDLSPRALRWKWGYWQRVNAKTRERSSRCLSAMLWDWYYSSGAKCVREHEGAWDDPNAPYWGGFQADLSFQRAYNPTAYAVYGTADRWPVIEQIEMAWRGWRARGWRPWPNTARACGLL